MECVRIGVIGTGNMGAVHAGYLLKEEVHRCRLTAVCDIDPERLKPFSGVNTFSDSGALIRSGEVDAVLIATPHYAHTPIGIDAFEQGLHVLMEKPISVHKADCLRLISAYDACKGAARSNGGSGKPVFGAMFQLRTQPAHKRLRRLIENGELGAIQRVNWIATGWFRPQAYYASGGWRATWKGEGGGILMNQCPHNLDLFQWLFGMPVRIRAFAGFGRYHKIEVEDEVTAYMEFTSGATAVFIASTGEAPGTDRLEITGDRGKIVLENGKLVFERNEIGAREFSASTKSAFDKPDTWLVNIPVTVGPTGHILVAQAFVDAILDGTPLVAPGKEGIHSVELANAMICSALEDKTVTLPMHAQGYEEILHRLIRDSRFEKKVDKNVASDMSKSYR